MKTNFRYVLRDLLLYMVGLSLSLIGLIVMIRDCSDMEQYYWGIIAYGLLSLLSLCMLLSTIKNIQWFDIDDGCITIHCPFGIIRRVQLTQIKKAFRTDAVIFRLRGCTTRRPYVVLCLKKSVTKSDADDAYNRRKKPYIAIPDTLENVVLIRTEYKRICGEDLIIK
jgi:hypothetical protein